MRDLKPIEGSELTEYVINLLHKNNIRTAIEFLAHDDPKLSKITNIPEGQIAALKVKLRRIYGPQVVNALYYCQPVWKAEYTTGIKSLDQLLGGGFRPGRLYEICGYSATGKSLLCTTIAMNFAKNHEAEVLHLDTKRDFSGTQMHHLLSARCVPKEDVGRIMQMIKVERCFSLREVIDILEKLQECLKQKTVSIKMLIIDSLPAVWYLFHGEEGSRKGKVLLTTCANLLKQIAKEHQLLVICVNVMVRNTFEEEPILGMDVDDRIDTTEHPQQPPDQQANPSSKPSLGKCWDGVPTIRLSLEDPCYESMINEVSNNRVASAHHQNPTEGMSKNQRVVRVLKSCFSSTGAECRISVDHTGIY